MARSASQGSILILVLWVLLFLSIFSQAVGFTVRQRLDFVRRLDIRQQLRDIADAGIHKGMAVLERKITTMPVDGLGDSWANDPAGFKEIRVGRGFFNVSAETGSYGMVDEERKIDINRTRSSEILIRLIQTAGNMSDDEAKGIAYSILDFRDEDDHVYQEGAENRYYESLTPPYRPKNRDFDVLEELRYVKGVTPEIYGRLEPYLTVHSAGWVNVNTASEPVLTAVGFSAPLVQKILLFRSGRDRIPGTQDDVSFSNLSEMAAALNQVTSLDDTEKAELQRLAQSGNLGTYSERFTIKSTAYLEWRKERLTVTCVVKRNGPALHCRDHFWLEEPTLKNKDR